MRAFRLGADGRSLFYLADQETADVFELFQSPLEPVGWLRRP